MRVAACQMPLLAAGSMDAVDLMRERVLWCEAEHISVVCFPEAILGGLADNCPNPATIAIRTDDGSLDEILAPLASRAVTSIVGFTEQSRTGELYNSAAVLVNGRLSGLFRKLHPAIRRSVYAAGSQTPTFQIEGLTFGILICNDSNFSEPARRIAQQGATAVFIPTNNGLPKHRAHPDIVMEATTADIARATEHGVWVIRADVAGSNHDLTSYGCTEIVNPSGHVEEHARRNVADMIYVDIGAL